MDHAITIERIERAIEIISLAIEYDGAVYLPYLDRLEAELDRLRAGDDAKARARRHLERLRQSAA